VRAIIDQLRAAWPDIIPQRDKELVKMLRAVRHIHRYPASDTKRGRPGRWKREELLKVSARLTEILERETSSHISLSSFVLSILPDRLYAAQRQRPSLKSQRFSCGQNGQRHFMPGL